MQCFKKRVLEAIPLGNNCNLSSIRLELDFDGFAINVVSQNSPNVAGDTMHEVILFFSFREKKFFPCHLRIVNRQFVFPFLDIPRKMSLVVTANEHLLLITGNQSGESIYHIDDSRLAYRILANDQIDLGQTNIVQSPFVVVACKLGIGNGVKPERLLFCDSILRCIGWQ